MTVLVVGLVAVVGGGAFLVASSDDGDEGGPHTTATTDESGGGPITTADPDDPSVGGDSPEDVVDAFVAASADGDCHAVVDLFSDDLMGEGGSEDFLADCEEEPEALEMFAALEQVGEAEVDGDVATVPVEVRDDPGAVTAVELVDEDGAWKIDGIDVDAGVPPGVGDDDPDDESAERPPDVTIEPPD